MKAVGYIRVSSEMQVKHGHSLDVQRQMITDYVHAKGWVLFDIFCETARSGKLIERFALQMLLDRARRGEFNVIVVTSFDRFHRNLLHLAPRDTFARNDCCLVVDRNPSRTTVCAKC